MCKWMGGWTPDELLALPLDYYNALFEMVKKEYMPDE